MSDLKKMYKTIMDDDFPNEMRISFGDQTLMYEKCTWKIPDKETGDIVEKGLRYGENPDQQAAMYKLMSGSLKFADCEYIKPKNGLVSSITELDMLQVGKHPGKINLTDLDNALNILMNLAEKPVAAIMKHNNPSGIAYGSDIADAYYKADMADKIAAFGGCLCLNRPVTKEVAELISKNYLEVVAAPEYEEGTIEILSKRKNLRIIKLKKIGELAKYRNLKHIEFKSLMDGGIIIQQSQINKIRSKDDFIVAKTMYKGKAYLIDRKPTEREYEDMIFGWGVEMGVSSNSVIFVKNGVTVGIGTGEQDRVGVAEIAVSKAYAKYRDALCFKNFDISFADVKLRIKSGTSKTKIALQNLEDIYKEAEINCGGLKGSVMISDAFFPFRDGVDVGIEQGVSAIVQSGGSERDFESINACNEAYPKVTMVFTGQRVFKH